MFKKLFNKSDNTSSMQVAEAPSAQITKAAGIGDRYRIFEKTYGENNGVTEWGRFQNNTIFVRFFEDRAIMVQLIKSEQPLKDKEEALQTTYEILPTDANIIEQRTEQEDTNTKAEYLLVESQLLKSVFENKLLDNDNTINPQYCSVCLTSDEKGYNLITVSLGDQLFRQDKKSLISTENLF